MRTLALLAMAGVVIHKANGDGVSAVLTAKTLPPATIQVIDPESGTSSGGGTTDVKVAVGDIILFRFKYFPVPDKIVHGLQGYLTEYVPPNTQVVGVRFTDANGNTIEPNLEGIATDSTGRSPPSGYSTLPCTVGTSGCSAGGTRSVGQGSISQLYADTGVFYSTDARTARNPNTQFLSFTNGIDMSSAEPTSIASVSGIMGASSPFHAHNTWDWIQVRAFGASSAVSTNSGKGNTPFLYGSPVAGSNTYYGLEATEPTAGSIKFNNVTGPWNRIKYPGSQIGFGSTVGGSGPLQRMEQVTASGFDLTPLNPLPATTNAVRYVGGEIRVGEPLFAEVALKVTGTPIDPIQGKDVDCAETTGGDTSAASASVRALDNMWGLYLGSPQCAFLNLLFDLTVDNSLATTGATVTYTLHGKNLSINPQTNVVIHQKFDSTQVSFVSATGTPTVVANCEGDGLTCLVWPTTTLLPSDEYTFTSVFSVGGGGHVTDVMVATYRSDQLPAPGYRTQAIGMAKQVAVPRATLDTITTAAAPGATKTITGTIANVGSASANLTTVTIVLPTGWTVSGSPTLNGGALGCSGTCTGTNTPTYNLGSAWAIGESRALSFTVNVPAGTATNLYPIDLEIWGSQSSFGGSYETYFPKATKVPVGQPRSAPPTLLCPINKADTTISGTTTEADGTTIKLYFNLIQRASGASAGGAFTIGGYVGTFGPLYGGLEIRASATAPGKLESELSTSCIVTNVAECSNAIDDDLDGLIDFPSDPGCSGPNDNNEVDPPLQCSDGIDNDADGLIDWPADPGCSGPTDPTESGLPECSDGIDNDGDGFIDFPADVGCFSALDGNELNLPQCADGLDNDGDGAIDFPGDLGCHSANDNSEVNPPSPPATAAPKARLLVVFDTSGSMNWNSCNNTFTGGDGSAECAGADVTCGTCSTTGCGNAIADDSRISKVKVGLSDVIAGFGEVDYGLMRFHQRPMAFACPGQNASLQSGGWQGGGASPCPGGFYGGDLLVSFSDDNQYDLLAWMDGSSNYPGGNPPAGQDLELRGSGTTPLAGALDSALAYLNPVRTADARGACRPYRVILVTDGAESCGGNAPSSAAALLAAGFQVSVIGFATPDPTVISNLNAIAAAGGTGSAIFVDDANALSIEMAQIVEGSILTESCNGLDDNCNSLVDEAFPDLGTACNNGLLGACFATGTRVCKADGTGTYCNAPNITGTPEVCNGIDDDCNGLVDDGIACMPCTGTEICNGVDDDCNGIVDDGVPGVGAACGLSLGACMPGTLQCIGGNMQCVGGTGPTVETCNNIDDDCNGIVDGMTVECYTAPTGCTIGVGCQGVCRTGLWTCTAGVFGPLCNGEVTPTAETCNGLDDDCDGAVDEDFPLVGTPCDNGLTGTCLTTGTWQCSPDGSGVFCTAPTVGGGLEVCNGVDDDCDGLIDEAPLGPPIGDSCGGGGACTPGTLQCVGGAIVCVGGSSGTPEVCNGVDDNCNGLIDEPPLPPPVGDNCTDPGFEMIGDTGTCEFGHEECVVGMLVCEGYIGPSPEVCNGLDDNCDGIPDDMAACPVPTDLCYMGTCVSPCGPGEFPCPADFTCMTFPEGQFCVPSACANVTCPTGFTCDEMTGGCVDLCSAVTCLPGQTCENGFCVDCTQLGCPTPGTECVVGANGVGTCVMDPCYMNTCDPVTQFCRPQDGMCIDACTMCPTGQVCFMNACVPDMCSGVTCPAGQTCRPTDGACISNPCADVTCGPGLACDPGDGHCVPDPCPAIHCPAMTTCVVQPGGAGMCVTPPPPPGYDVYATSAGGCSCEVDDHHHSAPSGAVIFLGLAVGAFLVGRRRRR